MSAISRQGRCDRRWQGTPGQRADHVFALPRQASDDLETFISKLPTPDSGGGMDHDPNTGCCGAGPRNRLRTSKEPTVIVKYEATEKHPAQTELFTKDILSAPGRRSSTAAACRRQEECRAVSHPQTPGCDQSRKEQANLLEIDRQKPLMRCSRMSLVNKKAREPRTLRFLS